MIRIIPTLVLSLMFIYHSPLPSPSLKAESGLVSHFHPQRCSSSLIILMSFSVLPFYCTSLLRQGHPVSVPECITHSNSENSGHYLTTFPSVQIYLNLLSLVHLGSEHMQIRKYKKLASDISDIYCTNKRPYTFCQNISVHECKPRKAQVSPM